MSRERQVVLLLVAVVAIVLGLAVITAYVPPLDDFIGNSPIVIVGLIVVTAAVLVWTLRPRRS